jgi:hypothetical protein
MRRPMHGDTLTRQAGDLSVRPHQPRRARKPGPAAGRSAPRPEIPPTERGAVAMNTAGAGDTADLGSVLLCAIIDGWRRLAVFAEMAPWRPADLTKQSSPDVTPDASPGGVQIGSGRADRTPLTASAGLDTGRARGRPAPTRRVGSDGHRLGAVPQTALGLPSLSPTAETPHDPRLRRRSCRGPAQPVTACPAAA